MIVARRVLFGADAGLYTLQGCPVTRVRTCQVLVRPVLTWRGVLPLYCHTMAPSRGSGGLGKRLTRPLLWDTPPLSGAKIRESLIHA